MMQKYGNYPLRPYSHQNMMPYPSRNNFYLRYSNNFQPKVYYDSQDIYDYQNVYDQDYVRPVTDVSSYNQQYRKYADVDSEDLPYSPYYNAYNQNYHLVNKYYGKNLCPETGIHLNKYNLEWEEKPFSYYPVSSGNYQTGISRNLYPSKDLDVTYNHGISKNLYPSKDLDMTYNQGSSRNLYPIKEWDVTTKQGTTRNLYPIKEWDVTYNQGNPLVNKYFDRSMKAPLDLENVKLSFRIPLEKLETDNVRSFFGENINQGNILNFE